MIIKISESPDSFNEYINFDIELLKDSIITALNNYLDDNFLKLFLRVFEWKFPKYYVSIKQYPHTKTELGKKIKGNSFQLALGIAYISKWLNIKIKDNAVFTGGLKEGQILKVESIEEKFLFAKKYIKQNIMFFCNADVGMANIFNFKFLKDVFDIIFDDNLGKVIFDKLNDSRDTNLPEFIKLSINTVTGINNTNEKIKITLFDFLHNTLSHNFNRQVFSYLDKVRNQITNYMFKGDNVVISGIKPNYMLAYILLPLFNYNKSILALTNAQAPNPNPDSQEHYPNSAIVVQSKLLDFPSGDLIYYKQYN